MNKQPTYVGKINDIHTGRFKQGDELYLDPNNAGALITKDELNINKSKFKKFFRFIGKLLLWVLYLMLTGKERQMYQHALLREREVLDVKNDAFGSTFTMGKRLYDGQKPKRNYMTWKEYRKTQEF